MFYTYNQNNSGGRFHIDDRVAEHVIIESHSSTHAELAERRRGKTNIHSQTPVEIDGIVYEGVIVAAEKLSVSRRTISNWIKKGKAKYV